MPKINCTCGNIIDLGIIPNKHQILFISDVEFDKFKGNIDVESIYSVMNIAITCFNCNRLYIYNNGDTVPSKIYKLEAENP